MSGTWENKLRNLAEGGQPWDIPARRDLIGKFEQLKFVLEKVASEPGLTGDSGTAASQRLGDASKDVARQIDYLKDDLNTAISDANAQRGKAQELLAALGSGKLNPGQEALVRGAAMGTTIVLGPFSILAGEGAVQAFNAHLSGQREEEAETHYNAVKGTLSGLPISYPPPLEYIGRDFENPEDDDPLGPTGPTGPTRSRPTGTSGLGTSPEFELVGTDLDDGDEPTHIDYEIPDGDPRDPDYPGPVIDLEPIPDDYVPTPDGPTGGIGTLPGHGTLPGSGLGGIGGGSSAGGIGSGLGVGLAAGAGGAAALRSLGGGAIGGAAGGGAAARGGGLLGRGGAAGGALGARGAGMMGGGAMGGAAGGGAGARGAGAGAGARGAGMMGGGAGGTGAAGGAAGGRGAGARGAGLMGGAGGGGARGDRKAQHGQGLGGPIAERMDDDEDFGPRSENAGAGGRD